MNSFLPKFAVIRWAAVALVVIIWIALILLGHQSSVQANALKNNLFGPALLISYCGLWTYVIFRSSDLRRMAFTCVTTTITLILVAILLELPAALRLVHWDVVLRRLSQETNDYHTAYIHDPDLSFRRISNFQWSGRPLSDIERSYGLPRSLKNEISFTYDQWGYRNHIEMPTARVVLIGDSYVEGWYVSDEETVAAELTRSTGWAVANLGVAGYGTAQELHVLKNDAFSRKPEIVIWFFFEGNDLYDDQSYENAILAKPILTKKAVPRKIGYTDSHGWRQRSFLMNTLKRLPRWSHPLIPNDAPYWAYPFVDGNRKEKIYFFNYGKVPWTDYEVGRWEKTQEYFKKGASFTRQQNIKILIVYVPTKYRVYRDFLRPNNSSNLIANWNVWPLPTLFMRFCEREKIACTDLTDSLKLAVEEGALPFPHTDTHWNAQGHSIAATHVTNKLRQLGWLSGPDTLQ
jgi:hypothetical protein